MLRFEGGEDRLDQRTRSFGAALSGLAASFALLPLVTLSCAAEQPLKVTTDTLSLPIGDSNVDLVVHRSERPGLAFLNLHDDEDTAADAAVAVVRSVGGTVYELQHVGDRNLTFQLDDSSYTVDPNRIFTSPGIEATLERHGTASDAAQAAVASFADSLLRAVRLWDMPVIVTVHNNTDEEYSALSYVDGGAYAVDAEQTHTTLEGDPDDFFFVTSLELFEILRAADANVVLQDNDSARDDGSLSILAGREGIPYVNVEAQHEHLDVQRGMLETLHAALGDL